MTEQEKYVLREIIRITGDTKSRAFWKKALKELGANRVSEDLGELEHQTRMREKDNPAAYLTTLLKERMNLNATPKKPAEKLNTYFEKTQGELFYHLRPLSIPRDDSGESENMPVPYSGKNIPWPTFIGPEFFTLSTNKKKSDKVKALFRSLDGETTELNLIRGKVSAGDKKERGIPTVQHQRVLAALKLSWAQQDCPNIRFKDGTLICYVVITARELAKLLGWKKFGGWELNQLKTLIMDLKSMPYCFDFAGSNIKGIENYYFSLVGDFEGFDMKKKGGRTAYFKVYFSSAVSWQLLQKHSVIRPKKLIQLRSEIAALLWLYLEPNLRSHGKACISLSNLIKVLQLPEAQWHKYPGHRKKEFGKAIKELNGQRLADGRKMIIFIPEEKGLYDWQLVAHLESYAIKQLEN